MSENYKVESEYSVEIEIIQTSLKTVKDKASKYMDRIGNGEKFLKEDVKDLENMKEQTQSIRDITKRIPIFGDLIEITADLTEILNRALKLMIENMKSSQTVKSEPIYVNEQGKKLSDEISKTMRASTKDKKKESGDPGLEQGGKLVARSDYFGYSENPEIQNEKSSAVKKEEAKPDLDKEAEIQAKLDAYNEDVKRRGEASKEAEEKEMSSGTQLAPSKEE